MQTSRNIRILREAKREANREGISLASPDKFEQWKSKVRYGLVQGLGANHPLVQKFANVRYWPVSIGRRSISDERREASFVSALSRVKGMIDAAVFEIEQEGASDDWADDTAFDPDLWEHVQDDVQAGKWDRVARETAIFVEDRVRQWSGNPKDKKTGKTLFGKALFAVVLGDSSEFRLGKEAAEWEGWRMLGTGFIQALSNVDRHNIQRRTGTDAKRYAFGVLGLGSLILTQLRYQHGEDLNIEN